MDSILEVPIRVNSEGEIEVQVMPRLDENGKPVPGSGQRRLIKGLIIHNKQEWNPLIWGEVAIPHPFSFQRTILIPKG